MCRQRADNRHVPHCSSQCLTECFFQKNTRLPILLVPKPTYQNPGERRKTKGKQEKGVLWLWKIERVELLLFFFHSPRGRGGGGAPVDREYVPEKYGVPSIDVDLDGLGLFMSLTDIACLGDLLNANCFIGEAEGLVKEFLSSTS